VVIWRTRFISHVGRSVSSSDMPN